MDQKKTVLALGFFDGLHLGHGALLRTAKARAAELDAEAAILTFDIHPDTFLKKTPVELLCSPEDRRYIAKRLYDIDKLFYVHFNSETMRLPWQEFLENVTEKYHAAHVVVGHDFSCGHMGAGTADKLQAWCGARGIGFDVIPPVIRDGIVVSSTYIRELIRRGDMERAAAFLGHPHLLTDTVRTGFRIGRTMDFPTVNMQLAEGVLEPRRGVYASRAVLPDGSVRSAVTNIGMRPTFQGDRVTVETHILDFSADLYGQRVCVELCRFLRDEQKFGSAEELSAQIRADAAAARAFFAENT